MWLLDEEGGDVNGTTPLGSTPLHYPGSLDILTALMDRGANPTLSDNRGWTPLMGQACRGKPDNVGRLLEDPRVRAAIDVLDEIGFTSLHWACIRFEEDFATSIILLLLQAGGNPAITNNRGETPTTLIRHHHPTRLITIALLEQVPDTEKTSLLVKARLAVAATAATASNTTLPSCLQGRVAQGQPLPRVAWRRRAPPRKATGGQADPKEFRNLMAFVLGMEGGPENTGMPRDVFRGVLMDLLMPTWDPLRQGGWDGAAGSAGLRAMWGQDGGGETAVNETDASECSRLISQDSSSSSKQQAAAAPTARRTKRKNEWLHTNNDHKIGTRSKGGAPPKGKPLMA